MNPPLVVAGMHRSGTGLLVELLAGLGLFPGARLDPNGEAYFFLHRNEWLLRRAGGAWDRPGPAVAALKDAGFRAAAAALLRRELRSRAFADYTGSWRHRLTGRPPALGPFWGWKDPRNLVTLPLWAELFPGARLLHIVRHGVDVAASLRRRAAAAGPAGPLSREPLLRRLRRALRPVAAPLAWFESARCADLGEAFRLWEEYAEIGENLLNEYEGPKLRVRYEELLARPGEVLPEVLAFCGLPAGEERARELAGRLRRDRAEAFRGDPELLAFHEAVGRSPWLVRLGYAAPASPVTS